MADETPALGCRRCWHQQKQRHRPRGCRPHQDPQYRRPGRGIGVVLGSFVGGFLPALAAVIMGHIAQKREPWATGFWVTALIAGYVGVGISLISGIGALLIFLAAPSGSTL